MRRSILLVILTAATVAGCARAAAVPSRTAAPPAGRPALIAHVGILRRHATPADTSAALRATLRRLARAGCDRLVADPGFIRLATVTAKGTRVYVVAFKPSTCTPHCTGTARTCIRPLPKQETVAVVTEPGEDSPQIATLADLEAGRAGASLQAGKRFELFVLVPDGVARLVLQIVPPSPGSGRAYSLGAKVHENVGVFSMSAPPPAGATLIWLDHAGRVVERLPNY